MAITCKVELFGGFEPWQQKKKKKKKDIFVSHHINVNAIFTHDVHDQE